MRKLFTKIHLWLSVPFGIIITIICFSGAMLVFEKEINELLYPERYFVEQSQNQPLSMELLMGNVAKELPDTVSVTSVTVFSNPERAYQVALSKPRRASLYLNQYTGEIVWHTQRGAFFTTMFRLHRWLLDSMKPNGEIFWGKMIVGTSTLVFVFVLLTGLIIWVPRTLKGLRNRLKISLNRGMRRFWYDLHLAGGFYTLIFLLAMALTGLTWSFQWYRAGFYKIFGVEMPQQTGHGHGGSQARSGRPQEGANMSAVSRNDGERRGEGRERSDDRGANRPNKEGEERVRESQRNRRGQDEKSDNIDFSQWQQVFEKLATDNSHYAQIRLSERTADVTFEQYGNQRASDQYTFEPATGEITAIEPYIEQEASSKIRGWIFSVHVGNWGGMFTRILTVIAALIGAALPLTGYYMWYVRTRAKRKNKKR